MKLNFCTIMFLLCSCALLSQNENSKWYFGDKAGLDFMTTPPTILVNSASNSLYGCATVADASGNLLFYTDGQTVYNKNHTVMANGTGLGITTSTSQLLYQHSMIIKQPGSSNIYLIFSNCSNSGSASSNGIYCSFVDMSLAAGMGSVTAKNALISSVQPSGQFTAAQHCNGKDVWLLAHDVGNGNFRAFLINSTGVSLAPVISTQGANGAISSYMKVSFTGKKIATVFNGAFPTVYDFDSSTGVVSNSLALSTGTGSIYNALEFSPDGTKLYCSSNAWSPFQYQVVQWDLCAGSGPAIVASRVNMPSSQMTDGIQLAHDGKIYVARQNQSALGVINNPNAAGGACNYVDQGQSIAPMVCRYSLPNFVSRPRPSVAFTYSMLCQSVQFTYTPATSTLAPNCAASTYSVVSWSWNFGDPLSGTSNTSTAMNPTHLFSSTGTFTPQLILNYPCFTDTVRQVVTVTVASASYSVTGNFSICPGNSSALTISGASSYTWSTGSTNSLVILSPSVTTVYTVSAMGTNVCAPVVKTVTVHVIPSLLAISGPSIACPANETTLSASGLETYSWSTGSTTNVTTVSQVTTTVYSVTGTDSKGCTRTATLSLPVHPGPKLLVSVGGTVICEYAPRKLGAAGASSYTWSTGATSSSITVQPSVSTVYSVSATDPKGCVASASLNVLTNPLPKLSISGDFSVCSGEYVTLTVDGAPTVTWSTSDTTKTTTFIPLKDSIYSVSATADNGCVTSTLIPILIRPTQNLVLSGDVNIMPGSSASISVSGGSDYVWSPDSMMSCTTCANPVVAPRRTTRYCVTSGDYRCRSENCLTVEVTCTAGDLSVPNAFTPNGDGVNDEFCLQGWKARATKFSVMVFNRWGEKVFESGDPAFCWNGIFKGRPIETGVFMFTIGAKFFDGSEINKKGNITLVR